MTFIYPEVKRQNNVICILRGINKREYMWGSSLRSFYSHQIAKGYIISCVSIYQENLHILNHRGVKEKRFLWWRMSWQILGEALNWRRHWMHIIWLPYAPYLVKKFSHLWKIFCQFNYAHETTLERPVFLLQWEKTGAFMRVYAKEDYIQNVLEIKIKTHFKKNA